MKKRTKINWKEHKLTIINYDNVVIYDFAIDDSGQYRLRLMNAFGTLSITGDFGNWIVSREFHPGPDVIVDDWYWVEKVAYKSTQVPIVRDKEATDKLLRKQLKRKDINDEERDFLENLLGFDEDSIEEYVQYIYRNRVGQFDWYQDEVPHETMPHFYLKAIFDGFEAIGKYMKKQSGKLKLY